MLLVYMVLSDTYCTFSSETVCFGKLSRTAELDLPSPLVL